MFGLVGLDSYFGASLAKGVSNSLMSGFELSFGV